MVDTASKGPARQRVRVLHPPLLALFPLLGLYAQNAENVPWTALIRPGIVLVAGAVGTWVILAVLLRNRYKAGLVTSGLFLAAMSGWRLLQYGIVTLFPWLTSLPVSWYYVAYAAAAVAAFIALGWRFRKERGRVAGPWAGIACGAVAGFLAAHSLLGPVFGIRAAWVIVFYASATVIAIIVVLRYKGGSRRLTQSANWFSGILVALFAANVLYQYPWGRPYTPPAFEATPGVHLATDQLPDIYFIVLDGYARDDVLRSQYGYNDAAFLGAMDKRGFVVARRSSANYPETLASLASCLNMDYLENLMPSGTRDSWPLRLTRDLYHNNRVYAFLKAQGYHLAVFRAGAALFEPRGGIDASFGPGNVLSEFEMVLVDCTAAAPTIQVVDFLRQGNPFYSRIAQLRGRIAYSAEELPRVAQDQAMGPKFVSARLLIPGPPFLFDREGGFSNPARSEFQPFDETFSGTLEAFRDQYREQIHYTNNLIQEIVDGILSASPRPPVILVISDHGPLVRAEASGSETGQPLANLILARFPDAQQAENSAAARELYDSLSLVNLFRVTLNRVFAANLPLLPDRGPAESLMK